MSTRRMKLRYAGTCAVCTSPLAPGSEAEWDRENRTATCILCLDGPPQVVSGTAGASARAMADRRRAEDAARTEAIKAAHPILGRIVLAVDPLPDRGKSWEKGAVGEEKFGALLDELSSASDGRVLVLHDRRIPRSKANIDHVAVTPTGIWVVDAKRYTGKVDCADRGGWLRSDIRLTVGGRDRSKVVRGVHTQLGHIASALTGSTFEGVPTHGALCFIDADWGWFAKPFAVGGVLVSWGKKLRERLVADGPVDEATRTAVHRYLAASFPPAS